VIERLILIIIKKQAQQEDDWNLAVTVTRWEATSGKRQATRSLSALRRWLLVNRRVRRQLGGSSGGKRFTDGAGVEYQYYSIFYYRYTGTDAHKILSPPSE
jgi:hypothetical protein